MSFNPDEIARTPIEIEAEETLEGIKARGLARNIIRFTTPALIVSGTIIGAYSATPLSEAVALMVQNGIDPVSFTAAPEYMGGVLRGIDAMASDFTGAGNMAMEFLKDHARMFGDGSLISHYEDGLRENKMGLLVDAYNYVVDNYGQGQGTGMVSVGAAAAITIAGVMAKRGIDLVSGWGNLASHHFRGIQAGIGRAFDRMTGRSVPTPESVFDPMSSPEPGAISGDGKREMVIAGEYAETFKKAGMPTYFATPLANSLVAGFAALGHKIRDLSSSLTSQSDIVDVMRSEIEQLRRDRDNDRATIESLRNASDPEKVREIAREMAEQILRNHGITSAPPVRDESPTLH